MRANGAGAHASDQALMNTVAFYMSLTRGGRSALVCGAKE
jgi:hypothetical protein